MHRRADLSLKLVLPGELTCPLFDAASTRAIESRAASQQAPHALMRRAGEAIARLTLATQPSGTRVHALAGPGNNGGDALVAATLLHRCGWQVSVSVLGDPKSLPPDAMDALSQAQASGVQLQTDVAPTGKPDLVLDGLLGIGLARAPTGLLADAIAWMNGRDGTTLAIDLPSGLDGDRGTVLGTQAVRATETLSLLTVKPGLFTAQGRDHAGRIWQDSLGVTLPASDMHLHGRPALTSFPHASHKGSFGDLLVIGGDAGMEGAACLAAGAALAAGAGRVYLVTLASGSLPVPPGWPELMSRRPDDFIRPEVLAASTVVCGCGGGNGIRQYLPAVLAHAARLVLDADALNAIAAEPALRRALSARSGKHLPSILTPHPLEAARLLSSTTSQVQANRLTCARELSVQFGCVAALKGSGTIVASSDGAVSLNPTGNALLATPGSGDVLAGWIGGTWARTGGAAHKVAGDSVWLHGQTADVIAMKSTSPRSLRASTLLEAMRDGGA